VQRALVRLRRRQIIPYGWIADGTRGRIKPTTFSSLEQAIERTARLYRRLAMSGVTTRPGPTELAWDPYGWGQRPP
jgi:hypothetical protein